MMANRSAKGRNLGQRRFLKGLVLGLGCLFFARLISSCGAPHPTFPTFPLRAIPTATHTPVPSSTATNSPTKTPTSTITNTLTITPTKTPTNSPTVTPTNSPTNTPSNSPTPTNTPLPPTVSNAVFSTSENSMVSGNLSSYTVDTSGNPLSYAIPSVSAHGTAMVNASTGAVIYTPNTGFVGTDSFTYQVIDTAAGESSSVATITVNVNDVPPTVSSIPVFTANDTVTLLLSMSNYFSDPVGNSLVYSVSGTDASKVIINSSTGLVTYNPSPGFTGVLNFNVIATDPFAEFVTGNVTVNVYAPPVSSNTTLSTNENSTVTGSLSSFTANPMADPLSYALPNLPSHGTAQVNSVSSAFTYTPNTGFVGVDSFTYQATDTVSGFSSSTSTITVNVNDVAPIVFTIPIFATNEDTGVSLPMSTYFADPAGNSLVYSVSGVDASKVIINSSTGVVTYNPIAGFTGSINFNVRATDPFAEFVTGNVTVNVNAVPPVASGGSVTTTQNTPLTVQLSSYTSSPVGDSLYYSLWTGTTAVTTLVTPNGGTVTVANSTTGAVNYTPSTGFTGTDSFNYVVTDAANGTAAFATIAITVN